MVNVYAKNTTMNIGEIIGLYIVAYLLVTKCPLPTCPDTGTLEKVGIEYPSIAGKKEDLTSKLLNYFVLCSI